MGYRSDVAYTIRFKNKEHRIRFMATAVLGSEIKLDEFGLIDDETIIFKYNAIKWYEEYEYVIAHKQLLEDAKEQGCAWEFCRVGEESGDTEQDGGEGIDDNGNAMDTAEEISICQSIYICDEGEPYPIGESLTQEDN
jgi:hypothetical protein